MSLPVARPDGGAEAISRAPVLPPRWRWQSRRAEEHNEKSASVTRSLGEGYRRRGHHMRTVTEAIMYVFMNERIKRRKVKESRN